MKDKFFFIEKDIQKRKENNCLRSLKEIQSIQNIEIEYNHKKLINFSSNDYLGLAFHPTLQKSAISFLKKYGNGSTASRLICGNYPFYHSIEQKLAILKETEASLIFNSGFQTNISLIPTLANRNSILFTDRLNHNSLIQGALLSKAKIKRYSHNNLNHLENLLQETASVVEYRKFIVTESVFSMDGDQSNIEQLVLLSKKYNAILIIDEAHATGVFGKNGMGLTIGKGVDITIGTFGKACGSFGAYVACSRKMKEYLVNFCPGFIYTTALPPATMGAIDTALDIIPRMAKERKELQEKSQFIKKQLEKLGFDTGNSCTQIIPILIGNEETTLECAKWLEKKGVFVVPIRPPTVHKKQCRIRLTLSVLHTWEHLTYLLDLFKKWKNNNIL